MKKIFILTGEPSGDKLAAEVIKELKNILKIINEIDHSFSFFTKYYKDFIK